jgi:transcriptional repressor NrdR
MKCPFCGFLKTKLSIRANLAKATHPPAARMSKCERRFTSYERIDEIPYMVIKKDGRRETFDRNKVMAGFCEHVKSGRCHPQSSIAS